jgi:hypothetical protein
MDGWCVATSTDDNYNYSMFRVLLTILIIRTNSILRAEKNFKGQQALGLSLLVFLEKRRNSTRYQWIGLVPYFRLNGTYRYNTQIGYKYLLAGTILSVCASYRAVSTFT